MRIAVTSDLHCDVTPQNRRLVPYLVEEFARLAPDALVLAGDLANNLAGWEEVLHKFQSLDMLMLVVPGNHDVWIESKRALRHRREDSAWKHDVALADIAAQQRFHYLPGNPLIAGDVAFVGSLGWYDYSLRDPRMDGIIGPPQYDEGTLIDSDGCTWDWNDARRTAWLRHPKSEDWRKRRLRLPAGEVFERIVASLEADCNRVSGRVTKLVAVIHTNPFRRCVQPGIKPDPFDAYQGSVRLGELLVQLGTQHEILCICGHHHEPLDMTERGIRVVRSPVGYLDRFDGDYRAKASAVIRVVSL